MESQGMSGEGFAAGLKGQKLRYVVLHHTQSGGGEADHFDLMIELPGAERLLTWRVMGWPEGWHGDIGAHRIADHRKAYLTYEGEISRGRGMVKRVEEGAGEVREANPQWLWLQLDARVVRVPVGAG